VEVCSPFHGLEIIQESGHNNFIIDERFSNILNFFYPSKSLNHLLHHPTYECSQGLSVTAIVSVSNTAYLWTDISLALTIRKITLLKLNFKRQNPFCFHSHQNIRTAIRMKLPQIWNLNYMKRAWKDFLLN